MLPFLVNMPRLYELFVSEWLNRRPPLLSCRKALERRGSYPPITPSSNSANVITVLSS